VVEAIKLPDPGTCLSFIGSEFSALFLLRRITPQKIVLPLIEVLQRSCF